MVKATRVGHVVLNTRDVAASTRFYTELLGFEISVQRPEATFLTCGQIHHDLALFKAAEGSQPAGQGAVGLNHIAIQVGGLEDLKDLYAMLKERGVSVRTVDHGMTGSVYFQDPDGNGIEVFFDKFENPADGLAEMRRPGRKNTTLVLD